MIFATGLALPISDDMGTIKVKHLKRYWAKTMGYKDRSLSEIDYHDEINLDAILLSVLGLGLEETLTNIYTIGDFDAFEDWILKLKDNNIDVDKVSRFNALAGNLESTAIKSMDKVLSAEDLAFFDENGYIIIRNAITKQDCDATIAVIADFLKLDINDPATWYTPNPARQGIMVQLFQHPVLQKNRDSELIRKAYEQLWGRTDIWVNTDRVGFNPPETDSWKFPGPRLHWDVSVQLPIPFGLQGILYLSDTLPNQGAFTLIPGFQNRIDEWINNLPEGANPRTEDLYALGTQPIAANTGDFIIWHQALPHGSSPNTSKVPRFVQYLNYMPINQGVHKDWK